MAPSLSSYFMFGAVLLNVLAMAADECQPHTWGPRAVVDVGQVNCRYETITGSEVDSKTCASIARRYQTTVDELVKLNPSLNKSCESIKPNETYCIRGFFEPARAWDGKCGPNHNATCIGAGKQCCNSKTWQCGDTDEDCKADVCYEGACYLE